MVPSTSYDEQVLHVRRKLEISQQHPQWWPWCEALERSKNLYWTPPGSNDDWFWIYAAVKAKSRGMLVTNDIMRDHVFAMLRPKHVLKWMDRHIARYGYQWQYGTGAKLPHLQYPMPYTTCVQQLETGAWMIPSAERSTWLCVRAVKV
eukprot:jgi/Chrzof1/15017/Cz09g24040.t1